MLHELIFFTKLEMLAMDDSILIKPFHTKYQQQVEELVLSVQNGEFKLGITAQDQPDLPNLQAFYQEKGGEFWIAVDAKERVLGCIGFEKLDDKTGALRKMFLAKETRGDKKLGLAQKLYDKLIAFAREKGVQLLCLDTPLVAHAAHRFYERNGWKNSPIEKLPASYKIPRIDLALIKFYLLNLT